MEKKLYYTYEDKTSRIVAWKKNRNVYSNWRKEYGNEWIHKKRELQLNLCFICLIRLGDRIHIDHIFPLYLGGTNSYANLCLTHPKCNMNKGIQVNMTYKEACTRRKLFNDLRMAIVVLDKLKENSQYKLNRKQVRRMKVYKKYSVLLKK